MSKHKTTAASKKKPAAPAPPASAPAEPRKDGIRETVESIVIAFVLAFLFRTFEAEAFVIPTGSMAPTLLGANKDLVCPECGIEYTVGASDEQDDKWLARVAAINAQLRDPRLSEKERKNLQLELQSYDVIRCTCPNCRFTVDVDPKNSDEYPTYKGDRILVAKFPYQLSNPDRWDVAVFKYPETANQNYIKRVVGLPGERIVIHRGDIFTQEVDSATQEEVLNIQRKPPEKVLAMMQLVHDNDHPSQVQQDVGWPARWQPLNGSSSADWHADDDGLSYATNGAGDREQWLVYRHTPPTPQDWRLIEDAKRRNVQLTPTQHEAIKPQLIGDFCAYDSGLIRGIDDSPAPRGIRQHPEVLGLHWVGDLVVECELQIDKPQGEVVLRLVKGGQFFDCTIDVATGEATLLIPGLTSFRATAKTPIVGPGTHRVAFANFDHHLYLWVDRGAFSRGEVAFDVPTAYDDLGNHVPTTEDLDAVRIGSRGAAVRVDHLRVYRDIYYVSASPRDPRGQVMNDYVDGGPLIRNHEDDEEYVAAFLADPSGWAAIKKARKREPLDLKEDQFLMLGDNSPQSKDSRLWTARDENGHTEYYVKRELLTGKALFVYWPHSWNTITGTNIPFPFFPNFAQMRLVR